MEEQVVSSIQEIFQGFDGFVDQYGELILEQASIGVFWDAAIHLVCWSLAAMICLFFAVASIIDLHEQKKKAERDNVRPDTNGDQIAVTVVLIVVGVFILVMAWAINLLPLIHPQAYIVARAFGL